MCVCVYIYVYIEREIGGTVVWPRWRGRVVEGVGRRSVDRVRRRRVHGETTLLNGVLTGAS